MGVASVKGDVVLQTPAAHCHQTHPVGSATAPVPLPVSSPLKMQAGADSVKIAGKSAIRVGDKTSECSLGGCPKATGGPGEVSVGSVTVMIEGKGAARVGDPTKHQQCSGPVPALSGTITGPGAATVMIG